MQRSLSFVPFFLVLFSLSIFAEPQARIMHNADWREMTQLEGGVHPLARPEFDEGALDLSESLHRIVISFNRTAAQQQELDQLLEGQEDPASAYYHQWLTPQEFAARFGMAQTDLARVEQWLVAHGFTVDEIATGGGYIAFSGSVGQVNAAFNTEIHRYNVDGAVHFANATSPAVPTALARVVVGFDGLNDFRPRPSGMVQKIKPDLTSGTSGGHYLTPDDFVTIYDLSALYSAGIDGTGQTIAIMGQTNVDLTDINTFRSVSGLTPNAPQIFDVPNSNPSLSTRDLGEADLDIEWSGAVARNASIVYVNSGNGTFDSMRYTINNLINGIMIPIISMSYGDCEPNEISNGSISSNENLLQQASAQGQTVVVPAGDQGAADCDYPVGNTVVTSATHGLAVDYPASSQFAVGVGGTTFSEGSGDYWYSLNDNNNKSVWSYIPEVVWNDTSSTNSLAAAGGGASKVFPKPVWQAGVTPNDNVRDVPDISFAASPSHDGYVTCSEGSCQVCFPGALSTVPGNPDGNCPNASSPGYRRSTDQTINVAGGTSAGVPTFAGLVALLNQKAGSPQGSINKALYQLAGGSSGNVIFHDITSGDNMVPCTKGTADCANGSSIGYAATAGYDQATGLGTVDGYSLVNDWPGVTKDPDFTLSMTSSSITVPNEGLQRAQLSVQPHDGFTSTVSLTCTSPSIGLLCSVSPSTVSGGGTTTLIVNAAFSSARQVPLPQPVSPQPVSPYWEYSFGVAALFVLGNKKSKVRMAVLLLATIALVTGFGSCGGGGSGSSNPNNGGSTGNSATLALSPSTLSFNCQIGGAEPPPQALNVHSSVSTSSLTYVTSASSTGWLQAIPSNNFTPGTVVVSVNHTGLRAGTYNGTITVSSTSATNSPQTASVIMNVAETTSFVTVQASSGALSHAIQIPVTVN